MMIQSVWKNLTGLQKAKSLSQLNTSGVTLNKDLESKTHHQTPMTCTFIIWTKVLGPLFPLSCACARLCTASATAAQRNNVPRTRKDEMEKPFDSILIRFERKKRIAMLGRFRAGAAVELEPVNSVYRFHRKRKNDVRQTSRCKPNT